MHTSLSKSVQHTQSTKGEGSSSHHKGDHDEKTKAADGRRSRESRDSDYVLRISSNGGGLPWPSVIVSILNTPVVVSIHR